jgi:hypothetical protein
MRRKDQLAGVIGLVVGLTCLLNVSARADIILNFAFEFDPPPTVIFTGTLVGGGTVSETFSVTAVPPPFEFQTFDFTGFTGLTSVSWVQDFASQGLHQFGNVHLSTAVPEPCTLALLAIAIPLVAACRSWIGQQS